LNLLRSDFKYPTDFGFSEKCRIPSDSDADLESATSLCIDVSRYRNGLNSDLVTLGKLRGRKMEKKLVINMYSFCCEILVLEVCLWHDFVSFVNLIFCD